MEAAALAEGWDRPVPARAVDYINYGGALATSPVRWAPLSGWNAAQLLATLRSLHAKAF
jgi:hypothetical protein